MPAQDFEQLMSNPYFQMGARMMAANQGKGMAPGAAFGGAAMGTMADLSKTRAAASKRGREEKALDLTEKRLSEMMRANQAKEKLAGQGPEAVLDKSGNRVGTTMGGRFSNAPTMSMMDMMMMNMMPGMGMPGMGGGGAGAPPKDPYAAAVEQFSTPDQQPSPTSGAGSMPEAAPQPAPAPAPAPAPVTGGSRGGLTYGQPRRYPPTQGAMPAPMGANVPAMGVTPTSGMDMSKLSPQQMQGMLLNPGLDRNTRAQINLQLGRLRSIPLGP